MKKNRGHKRDTWWLALVTAHLCSSLFSGCDHPTAGPVGQSWPAEKQLSCNQINHSVWSALLKKHVTEAGRVDYTNWYASVEDRQRLNEYLKHLSQADPDRKASRTARLAFWINAYNALTVRGILDRYPTSSIRNHTNPIGYNIWKDLLLQVGNQRYSLDQIEHSILRSVNEPRIHFAIVCASLGCPPLRNEAYQPETLDEQLASNAQLFFQRAENLTWNPQEKTLYVNPILGWFRDDFGATTAERLRTIMPYFPADLAFSTADTIDTTIDYLPYDWNLNDLSHLEKGLEHSPHLPNSPSDATIK